MISERMPTSRDRQLLSKRVRKVRANWIGTLIAALISSGVGVISTTTRASAPDAGAHDGPSQPFFAHHCQACHAGPKPKGDFRLESLSPDFTDPANRDRWLDVLEQVKSDT